MGEAFHLPNRMFLLHVDCTFQKQLCLISVKGYLLFLLLPLLFYNSTTTRSSFFLFVFFFCFSRFFLPFHAFFPVSLFFSLSLSSPSLALSPIPFIHFPSVYFGSCPVLTTISQLC